MEGAWGGTRKRAPVKPPFLQRAAVEVHFPGVFFETAVFKVVEKRKGKYRIVCGSSLSAGRRTVRCAGGGPPIGRGRTASLLIGLWGSGRS